MLYYYIDMHKLAEVTRIFNEETGPATEDQIEGTICADWPDGESHQAWINSAAPEDLALADWLASFYEV